MLEVFADLSAIATAAAAVGAFSLYQFNRWKRRSVLVAYLKKEANSTSIEGLHSMTHLMARLRMTEAEILRASFESRRVACKVSIDPETGLANQLLFGYRESTTVI